MFVYLTVFIYPASAAKHNKRMWMWMWKHFTFRLIY